MSCTRCKEVVQSLKRGVIQAHLSPKAQIQDPLALNLALRLNLNHTAILIGCHDSQTAAYADSTPDNLQECTHDTNWGMIEAVL